MGYFLTFFAHDLINIIYLYNSFLLKLLYKSLDFIIERYLLKEKHDKKYNLIEYLEIKSTTQNCVFL